MRAVEVAVALPVAGTFAYRVPDRFAGRVSLGAHVSVPFGRRRVAGLVVALDAAPARATADLEDVLDAAPVPPLLLDLGRFVAAYYGAPMGEVVRTILPPGARPASGRRLVATALGREALRAAAAALRPPHLDLDADEERLLARLASGRGLAPRTVAREAAASRRLAARALAEARDRVASARAPRAEAPPDVETVAPPPLTPAQSAALSAIEGALVAAEFCPFLLHGVTGSGKTEVYLRAAERAAAAGRTALVLVPEIGLTPQLARRFRGRFGDRVAVVHSDLPTIERARQWRRLRAGEACVALGARSAVFAPIERIGLVVVDEEHDASYKQQDGVRYHARDLALVRARDERAAAVLGSATPSLESYEAARRGRYRLLRMPERVTPHPLPTVEILDLRAHPPDADTFLCGRLREAVRATLAAGRQAILFLNRRGFATLVVCRECGHTARCRDCSVALVWHRARRRLVCHWCGLAQAPPGACPGCGGQRLEPLGAGTERIEAALGAAFPGARVARVDRDAAASGARGIEATLAAAARREVDLLVGTQMIAKGHDLPGVTLVGVVLADVGMGLPDFRAAERTFQLVSQVAGRAGRGEEAGRVIVQTFQPDHPALRAAARHDYEAFFEGEAAARAELGYPPFGHLVLVRLDGSDEAAVERRAREIAATLRGRPNLRVMGPSPAPIARLRGRHRWHLALKAPRRADLRAAVAEIAQLTGTRGRVRVGLDVDPVSLL